MKQGQSHSIPHRYTENRSGAVGAGAIILRPAAALAWPLGVSALRLDKQDTASGDVDPSGRARAEKAIHSNGDPPLRWQAPPGRDQNHANVVGDEPHARVIGPQVRAVGSLCVVLLANSLPMHLCEEDVPRQWLAL